MQSTLSTDNPLKDKVDSCTFESTVIATGLPMNQTNTDGRTKKSTDRWDRSLGKSGNQREHSRVLKSHQRCHSLSRTVRGSIPRLTPAFLVGTTSIEAVVGTFSFIRYRFVAGIISVSVAVLLTGCKPEVALPPSLQGVWKTSAIKYQDRFLMFYDRLMVFGTGQCGEDINYITTVQARPLDTGHLKYTIHYRTSDGDHQRLQFQYNPDAGGMLRLGQRPEIWMHTQQEIPLASDLSQLCF